MNRRAGQIKRRGERRWLVSVFLGRDPDTGKRRYQAKMIHGTKKDAERYLTETLRRRDLGTLLEPAKMSLNAYLDRWLETAARPRVSARTFEDYTYLLAKHVRPKLGGRRFETVTPLDVQAVYTAMQARGLSARTVRVTHAVLSGAFKQAVAWRLLAHAPTVAVALPKMRRREMRALGPEEAERFCRACERHPMGLLFAFLLVTGMRPGEALALRWRDCDLRANRVHVTQTLERLRDGRWSFREPKTPKSRRAIPIPPSLTQKLAEYRAEQAKRRLLKGPEWQDHGLVFAGRNGQPLDQHNLGRGESCDRTGRRRQGPGPFKSIVRDAGIAGGLRIYDLRHSCATLLAAAGENPKVIAERLGHASTTLTNDTYSHVLPGMQERATAQLETILYGASA